MDQAGTSFYDEEAVFTTYMRHRQRDHFHDAQTYERRKRIPLFLILAACKPA
jgi:hypothetical protein